MLPPLTSFFHSNHLPVFSDTITYDTLIQNNSVEEIRRELTASSPQSEMLRNEIRNQLKHTLSEIEIAMSCNPDLYNDPQFRETVINEKTGNAIQEANKAFVRAAYHMTLFAILFPDLVKSAIVFLLQRPDESLPVMVSSGNSVPFFLLDNQGGEPSLFCRMRISRHGRKIIEDHPIMFLHLQQKSNARPGHFITNTGLPVSSGINSDSAVNFNAVNLNNNAAKIIKTIKSEEGLRREIYNQLKTVYIFIKSKQHFSEPVIADAIQVGINRGCQNLVKKDLFITLFQIIFPLLAQSVIEYFLKTSDNRNTVTVDKNCFNPRFFIDLRGDIPSLFGKVDITPQETANHHLLFLDFEINLVQSKYTAEYTAVNHHQISAHFGNQPAVLNRRTPYQRPQLPPLSPQVIQNPRQHNEQTTRLLMGNYYDPGKDPATNLLTWMLAGDGRLYTNQPVYLENLCFKLTEQMESDVKKKGVFMFWFPENVELRNCSWQCAATMVLENGRVWTDTDGAMIYATGKKAWAAAFNNGRVVLENGAQNLY